MESAKDESPLLQVEDLVRHFPVTRGVIFPRTVALVKAVDGVSFQIKQQETLGLVGESGCGKTTIARLILLLDEPTRGKILFRGQDIHTLPKAEIKGFRRNLQIIFQDPYSSLNPRMTAGEIIAEPLTVHGLTAQKDPAERTRELLAVVGLSPYHGQRYPHEFSGGQRQRIGIARALATEPKLIVCDEPVSALDVSIRAQVINLLQSIQERFGLAYIIIAHDLAMIKHASHRVAVMYLGKIVEFADRTETFGNPLHPYTRALLNAVPIADPSLKRERSLLSGDVPSPLQIPPGCRFHPRCPDVRKRCREEEPIFADIGRGHYVACHYWQEAGQFGRRVYSLQSAADRSYMRRMKVVFQLPDKEEPGGPS